MLYTLLIDSPDNKGLVYKITKVLFENGLNIEKNSEFVDPVHNKFFMRTEINGELFEEKILEELKKELPSQANIRLHTNIKKNIVIMVTKESHCLGDILIRYDEGFLNANILAVIGNHDKLRSLTEKFNIPFIHISHENLDREEHENLVIKELKELNPDYIILAKYMRILTNNFVNNFKNQIINIHHSFLPAFIGANPYKQAYERGVKIIGATSHFVTENLDEGPIIYQDVIPVDHTLSWKDMQRLGRDIEKIVLSKALNLSLNDHIFTYQNRTVIL